MLSRSDTLSALRLLLLATFVVGTVGTSVELVLIEHYEELWQLAPLLLMVASLLVLGWYGVARSAAAVLAFRGVLALFVVGAGVGIVLHYQGNVEFELERAPSLGGLALVWEAMRGATPALAPGAMLQLALVGLAWSFRHPVLDRRGDVRA